MTTGRTSNICTRWKASGCMKSASHTITHPLTEHTTHTHTHYTEHTTHTTDHHWIHHTHTTHTSHSTEHHTHPTHTPPIENTHTPLNIPHAHHTHIIHYRTPHTHPTEHTPHTHTPQNIHTPHTPEHHIYRTHTHPTGHTPHKTLTRNAARMILVTFSLTDSCRMSDRTGMMLYRLRCSHICGLKARSHTEKIIWYWSWKPHLLLRTPMMLKGTQVEMTFRNRTMQPEVEITDCSFCPSAPVSQNHVLSFLPAGRSKPEPCSQRASPHGQSLRMLPPCARARGHTVNSRRAWPAFRTWPLHLSTQFPFESYLSLICYFILLYTLKMLQMSGYKCSQRAVEWGGRGEAITLVEACPL